MRCALKNPATSVRSRLTRSHHKPVGILADHITTHIEHIFAGCRVHLNLHDCLFDFCHLGAVPYALNGSALCSVAISGGSGVSIYVRHLFFIYKCRVIMHCLAVPGLYCLTEGVAVHVIKEIINLLVVTESSGVYIAGCCKIVVVDK